MAERDERVLQQRAPRAWACTSPVATHATPRRRASASQGAVAGAVAAGVGALQLDPQALRAERVEQPPRGGLVVRRRGRRSPSGRPAPRRARSTASRLTDGWPRCGGRASRVCACARVSSRQRLLQPLRVADEQRQVTVARLVQRPASDGDLGAEDRDAPGESSALHRRAPSRRRPSRGRSAPARCARAPRPAAISSSGCEAPSRNE